MKEGDRKLRVGLFVLAAAGLFAFGIFKLGDVTLARTYRLHIYFSDIAGLAEKSPVKIAGVHVGNIKEISLDRGKARVTVAIRRDVPIYRDAKARVGSTGIIGSKFLDMTQGAATAGPLREGDSLSGTSAVSIEEAMAQGLEAIRGFTDSLRGDGGSELGRNFNGMIANLNALTLSLREILEERQDDVSATLLSMRQVAESLKEILAKTDRILASVEKGEGAFGTLLADGKVGEDVKAAVGHLKEASGGAAEVFGRFTRIRTFWDWRLRYDGEAGVGRTDFGIKLAPRPTRYYYLSGVNLGDKNAAFKTNDFEKRNTFSIGMGKEFFPWLDLHAGLIRGEGGVGAKVAPFYKTPIWNRISFSGEAYGFGRDTTINSRRLTGTVLNAGVTANIMPWLEIHARGEDLNQTRHVQSGMRVVLEDKDLAYLIGLITITR